MSEDTSDAEKQDIVSTPEVVSIDQVDEESHQEQVNEEEEKILENVTLELRNGVRNRLTENEMRRIREEAGRKRKYKKGKKHRKGRH